MAVGCIFPFHFYEGQEARKGGTESEIKQQEKRKEERKEKRKRALLCSHCEHRSENGWEVICIYTRIRAGVSLLPLNAYSSRGPEVSPVQFLATLSVGPLTLTRLLFLLSSYHFMFLGTIHRVCIYSPTHTHYVIQYTYIDIHIDIYKYVYIFFIPFVCFAR